MLGRIVFSLRKVPNGVKWPRSNEVAAMIRAVINLNMKQKALKYFLYYYLYHMHHRLQKQSINNSKFPSRPIGIHVDSYERQDVGHQQHLTLVMKVYLSLWPMFVKPVWSNIIITHEAKYLHCCCISVTSPSSSLVLFNIVLRPFRFSWILFHRERLNWIYHLHLGFWEVLWYVIE